MSVSDGGFTEPELSNSAQHKFWYAWFPLSIVGFAVIYLAFHLLYQFQLQKTEDQIRSAFQLATNHVAEDFNTALADLKFIADNPITQKFVDLGNIEQTRLLEELFLSLSKSHERYDQMRVLSPDGMELIRVNYNNGAPIAVTENLQDKAHRYYFTESLSLRPGEIFISQFDLNIENGVIEKPIKPTIRFSAPLFDSEGELSAVVVLNYFGDVILEHVSESFARIPGEAMLLSSRGDWLLSSGNRPVWAFMYGFQDNFSSAFPSAWEAVNEQEDGVFANSLGRFYFSNIRQPIGHVASNSNFQIKPWKLVVFDVEGNLGLHFFMKHLTYLYPLLVAYPLGSVLLWYWARAAAGRNRAEAELKALNSKLEEKVNQRTHELKNTRQATILSLATLAETRDNETGQHIRRTQKYAKLLAQELLLQGHYKDALNEDSVDEIFQSAPLHDIGKVGIPDNILHKLGSLSDEEFEVMKTHTTLGSNAIEEAIITISDGTSKNGEMTFLHCARDIAHYHHERWDGSGYPKGLCGEAIPISARIMALVDVYDALVSERVYKEAFSREKAERIILEESAGQFDPHVIEAFKAVRDEFWEIRRNFADPI